jgi:exopolyphosphatase/guanosine-5'-triphosphate,3'-diphosphate pyrophosphatase
VIAPKRMRVGAIDVGSNSVRLLVADVLVRAGELAEAVTVARAGESCRLGRGLGRTGNVDPEMAERAATLAMEFARRARSLGAVHTLVGATAALRNAANGAWVAAMITDRTGLPVRILSGDEEARLVYQSVVAGLGARVQRHACVVFDIGGGSTEVVSGVGSRPGRWVSLPFGAVSLTERHLHSNPPAPGEIAELVAEVERDIMHQCALLPDRAPVLVGVGGTVTVLASMDRQLLAYDSGQLEGWTISHSNLQGLVDRLLWSRQEDRGGWPVMGEGRADIIVAGSLVVRALVARFPSSGLVCSTQGLRYGLARLAADEVRDRDGGP